MADDIPLDPVAGPNGLGVNVNVVIAPLPAPGTPLPATGGTPPIELGLVGVAVVLAGAAVMLRSRRRRGASGGGAPDGV